MARPRDWREPWRQLAPMREMEPMLLSNGKQYKFTIPDGNYISNAIKNHEKYKLIFDIIKEMMQTPEYSDVRKDNGGLPIVDHITYAMIIEKAFERTPYRWLPQNEIYIKNTNPANALTVSHMKVSRWNLPKPDKNEFSATDYKNAFAEYKQNEINLDREEGEGLSVQKWGEMSKRMEQQRDKEREQAREAERLASMPPPPPPQEKKKKPKHDSFESDEEIEASEITYDKRFFGDRSKKRKPKTYLKTEKTDKRDEYYNIYSNDDDQKLLGEMTKDGIITFQYGRTRKNEDDPLEGYDSEEDRESSEYPYEIITTYQETPETIAKYKALHYSNKALTEEQRRKGWEAQWDDTRKQPYYFNNIFDDDDDYQGATGTESRLNRSRNIIYEPYDLNSLPNYDRYGDGSPLPSNNSIAAEATAKIAALSLASEPSPVASSPTPRLPPNWTEQFSRTHQRPYWHNSQTGEKRWTPPNSGGKKKRKSKRKINKKSKRNTRRK